MKCCLLHIYLRLSARVSHEAKRGAAAIHYGVHRASATSEIRFIRFLPVRARRYMKCQYVYSSFFCIFSSYFCLSFVFPLSFYVYFPECHSGVPRLYTLHLTPYTLLLVCLVHGGRSPCILAFTLYTFHQKIASISVFSCTYQKNVLPLRRY